MEPWMIRDVTDWIVEHDEPRGKRPKFWVLAPDKTSWLRKEPRHKAEPAVEALMLRLAGAVGLSAPASFPCTWVSGGEERRGIVVRLFIEQSAEDLSLGSAELSALDPAYNAERHEMHTVARVRRCLERYGSAGAGMLTGYARMLAFDAWIGNGDRHQENWGLIHTTMKAARLAPLFDPAACLGVELRDGHDLLSGRGDLGVYLGRCPSGFGDGSAPKRFRGISQGALVEELKATWPEWRKNIGAWLASFEAAMDTFDRLVHAPPDDWLSPSRKEFAKSVLRLRLEWLRQVAV